MKTELEKLVFDTVSQCVDPECFSCPSRARRLMKGIARALGIRSEDPEEGELIDRLMRSVGPHNHEAADRLFRIRSEFCSIFPAPVPESPEHPRIPPRPTVVCLCGSTRFGDAYREANRRETLKGNIVLTVGILVHGDLSISSEAKVALDALHLRKIDLADEVLILDVDGYVGDSTQFEVSYAQMRGKKIRWLSREVMG